ncbi:MAG: hypothetical protein Q9217_003307 [Psora testacea]
MDTLELVDHVGWTLDRQLHVAGSSRTGLLFQGLTTPVGGMIAQEMLAETKQRMFSSAWLDEPDAEGHFPTNGDRFAAQELMKRRNANGYTRKGFIMQAIAAGWHHKTANQLAQVGDNVGRERIQVMHGTVDQMITFSHGQILVEELGGEERGVTFIVAEGKGHGLQMEWRRSLTKAIASLVEKTEAMTRS